MIRNTMPGFYQGYHEAEYPGYYLKSQYVSLSDGTKLAIDIIFPANTQGVPADGKFPTLLLVSRGGRFENIEGKAHSGSDILAYCVPYGYVGCVLEIRGAGASFGTMQSFSSLEDRSDVNEVLEWIGQQSWSDGTAALFGGSNRGLIQLATAVTEPAPSQVLKAITPVVSNADFYYQDYPNGVSALPGTRRGRHVHLFNKKSDPKPLSKEEFLRKVKPVDEDPDGSMAYEAYLHDQYGKNHGFMNWLLLPNMCRDDPNPNFNGEQTNLTIPPIEKVEVFKNSDIQIHQFAGLLESGTMGQLMQAKDFGGSILVGPWDHRESRTGTNAFPEGEFDFKAEHLKWFDNVLKQIPNGFDQKPPFMYYTLHAKDGAHWRCSDTFPLETERRMKLYLCPDSSGTIFSVHDGSLRMLPSEIENKISYQVDTSIQVFDEGDGTTLDRMHQWWNGDMTSGVDAKGLTFTSAPLFRMRNNEITGVTGVDLWVTCDQSDVDFIVYLEEVTSDGVSHYITQGVQRSSHRTSAVKESWNSVGATYHPCLRKDMENCIAEGMHDPVHLQFHIEPTSYQFSNGSRVRITVTCADCSTYQHPMYQDDLPTIQLYTGGDFASYVTLPFIEHIENTYNGHVHSTTYDGPGTLYFFKEHIYLYANGKWSKYRTDSSDAQYTMQNGVARFGAGFTFETEGIPITDGILQHYQGNSVHSVPLPSIRHFPVDCVPLNRTINETLYTPDVKTIYLDVFRPDHIRDGGNPCIAYIHGYGGTPGNLRLEQLELLSAGFTVIGLELRSYPGNYYPDYVFDLKGCIRAIRANAKLFGIDPNAIGVYGSSLGGNGALVLGMTNFDPTLEGAVGGNLCFSSRVQAMAVGFGWSDMLTMGKDLYDEYRDAPEEFRNKKMANTGGEQAPLSHVIGFSGPGKGLEALRQYEVGLLNGSSISDPYWDDMLQKAKDASPITHIAPDCAPALLYGGLGMTGVDIPFMQSYRTFEVCNKYGVECYLFANSNGEYGRKPQIRDSILNFFANVLVKKAFEPKTVAVLDSCEICENFVSKTLSQPLFKMGSELEVLSSYLTENYRISVSESEYVPVSILENTDLACDYYAEKNMAVLLPRKNLRVFRVMNRTS